MRLIGLAYDAGQGACTWAACLETMSELLQGRGAVMLRHDLRSRGQALESVGVASEAMGTYNAHYHAVDPWARGARTKEFAVVGKAIPDDWLLLRTDLYRTEFYADFVRPFDLTRMVTLSLAREDQHSVVSVFRGERDATFSLREVRFLEALIPHLRRAFRVHEHLAALERDRGALLHSLDAVPCAALITDGNARVLLSNRRGAALVVSRDGIGVKQGRLVAASTDGTQRLLRLCADAAGRSRDGGGKGGAFLAARADGTPLPLQVLVVPQATDTASGLRASNRTALVFIADPLESRGPREALLQFYYGLTPAEAYIASRLAQGHGLERIAADRRIALETARWYSKQILAKTGAGSRGDVVRQLTRSLAMLDEDLRP